MEIYQLKTFCKVAEVGNLTRAAEKLFTSQPAVSAQVKSLEEELGIRLFNRGPKGMKLTAAGQRLLEDAQQIINTSEGMQSKAASLRDEVSGILRIGVNNSADVLRSDQVVTSLARKYPRLGFNLSHGDSGDILSSIELGELDAGYFEGENKNPSLQSVRLGEIDLCIAVPAPRFEALAENDWGALAAQPWVTGSPTCSYSGVMEELAARHGVRFENLIHMNDDSMIMPFIAANLAICFAPRCQVEHYDPAGKVIAWPHFSHQMPLSIAYLKSREDDPALRAFVTACQHAWPA